MLIRAIQRTAKQRIDKRHHFIGRKISLSERGDLTLEHAVQRLDTSHARLQSHQPIRLEEAIRSMRQADRLIQEWADSRDEVAHGVDPNPLCLAGPGRVGAISVPRECLAKRIEQRSTVDRVASSKIEGLDAGPRRLVEAEAALAQGGETADRVVVEVLGNIAAMSPPIELAVQTERFSLTDLLEIHRVLMERSARPELGGVIREGQNWIGAVPTTRAARSSSHHHRITSMTFSGTSSST